SRVTSELMRSPLWLAATLAAWGMVMVWMSDEQPTQTLRIPILTFAIALFVAAGAIWMVTTWNDNAGRWFAIGCAVVALHGAISWFNDPVLLGLLLVPVVFAVILVGLWGALLVAVVQTSLLWAQALMGGDIDPSLFALSLAS